MKTVFPCVGISIIKVRLSCDSFFFIMGIHVLVRRPLYGPKAQAILAYDATNGRQWEVFCPDEYSRHVDILNISHKIYTSACCAVFCVFTFSLPRGHIRTHYLYSSGLQCNSLVPGQLYGCPVNLDDIGIVGKYQAKATSFQIPKMTFLKWAWRYESRQNKSSMRDTPSHASDHLCQ